MSPKIRRSFLVADLIQEVLNGLKALEEQELANPLIIVERGRLRVRRQNTTQ